MTHELKTWPAFFRQLWVESKTFEIRKNDRDFKEGETVLLKEWDPDTREYTGRQLAFDIGFVLYEGFGLKKGYCILSLTNPHQ